MSYTDPTILKDGQNSDVEQRWNSNAIKMVRVLLPPPYFGRQVYFSKNGIGVHGQKLLLEVLKDLLAQKQFPPHTFIWNDRNFSDNFMRVINKFPPNNSIILPDPKRIRQCAFENVLKNRDGTLKIDDKGDYIFKKKTSRRAKLATDIGVATSMANKRGSIQYEDGTTNHHSKPPMCKHTTEYSDVLRSCSIIATSPAFRPSWIARGQTMYTIKDCPSYVTEFAGQFDTDEVSNIVPAARCSVVSYQPEKLCGFHHDSCNGKEPTTETIGAISWNNPVEQVRLNFSSRQSQEKFVFRSRLQDNMLDDIKKRYSAWPPKRRYITSSLSEGKSEEFLPGFALVVTSCHCRPSGYYSLCLYSIEILFCHFGFSPFDMASVTFAIKATIPNSHLFLAVATQILISKYNDKTLPWRGAELGYQLQLLMFILKEHFLKQKHRCKHWLRFRDQRSKKLYSRTVIQNGSVMTLKLSLWLHANAASRPGREMDASAIFSKAITFDMAMMKGSGPLMAQHSVVETAITAYYPTWLRTYAILKPKAKPLVFLNDRYNLNMSFDAKECHIFLRTLCYVLKKLFPNEYCDLSISENVICKFSQDCKYTDEEELNKKKNKHKKTIEKQHDLYLSHQPVFEVAEDITIHHHGMRNETVSDKCLIGRYAFGTKNMLSMQEIACQCELPSNIQRLKNFQIEKKLWKKICSPVYPVGHYYYGEVAHQVKRLPKMNQEARAFANLIMKELEKGEKGDLVASFV